MQALALRYSELLHQRLAILHHPEWPKLPLSTFVDELIDITEQFFLEYPGYYEIFMEIQGVIPEVQAIEDAADAKLVGDLASLFAQREAGLAEVDYEAIAFVLVKAIGNLMWLSLSQEPPFRQRLIAQMKRFTLSYLQGERI